MNEISKYIEVVINQLREIASKKENNGLDIDSGLGEVVINGTEYQIQVLFKSDKKIWCKPDECRLSEVVKIHE